jgi:hypothetical protein
MFGLLPAASALGFFVQQVWPQAGGFDRAIDLLYSVVNLAVEEL